MEIEGLDLRGWFVHFEEMRKVLVSLWNIVLRDNFFGCVNCTCGIICGASLATGKV
jgi:hypothetical protein